MVSAAGVIWAMAAAVGISFADPAFEQHFSPAENLEAIDVALIDGAGETIDLAAYVLTDLAVIEALDNAAARGVRVRVFRDSDEGERGRIGEAVEKLKQDGAEFRYKLPGLPLMHLKAYCADGRLFRFGAANFSASGLKHQNNDLDVVRGPAACVGFEASFERMWGN